MKKFLVFLLMLVVIGGVLMATCPDRETHREAVKGVLSEVVNKEMDEKASQNGIDGAMASIGTALAISAIDAYLGSNLILRDHTFYNVGVVSYEDDYRMVSVGILNHVFTISSDDARLLLKDKLGTLLNNVK